jgi:hypothetical protein
MRMTGSALPSRAPESQVAEHWAFAEALFGSAVEYGDGHDRDL